MDGGKNWLSCKEVASILGYTQRHIINIIKKGKLSARRDETGQYFIDKSEFYRVYPESSKIELTGSSSKSIEESIKKFLEEKIRHLEELLGEKNKLNEFLTEQIQNFNQEKSKMLEAINSHARLLEYKESAISNKTRETPKKKWSLFKRK